MLNTFSGSENRQPHQISQIDVGHPSEEPAFQGSLVLRVFGQAPFLLPHGAFCLSPSSEHVPKLSNTPENLWLIEVLATRIDCFFGPVHPRGMTIPSLLEPRFATGMFSNASWLAPPKNRSNGRSGGIAGLS